MNSKIYNAFLVVGLVLATGQYDSANASKDSVSITINCPKLLLEDSSHFPSICVDEMRPDEMDVSEQYFSGIEKYNLNNRRSREVEHPHKHI
ncbi:hypothetical protein [Vibrio sp. D431a]|uniref:hypothetical protein n=1 Tax=Vibrio sp. D431a TaxID=2837388 RepID=UPI0025523AFD|nr:hypothetical protein [Vibrio sp. D431a]MDK9789821.1 hypothetical protein [Vibrio sp. D431a]